MRIAENGDTTHSVHLFLFDRLHRTVQDTRA